MDELKDKYPKFDEFDKEFWQSVQIRRTTGTEFSPKQRLHLATMYSKYDR